MVTRQFERGTKVRLFFPNTGHEYVYMYGDSSEPRVPMAIKAWYKEFALDQFALSGRFAPMDVQLYENGRWKAGYNLCYMDGLYACFYEERYLDPWDGDFIRFLITLSEQRAKRDKAAEAA